MGTGCVYASQRYMDSIRARSSVGEESLYLTSGKKLKAFSLGMSSLIADVYWIRTVQYFGRKVIDAGGIQADIRTIPMPQLGPLLNIVVELDPHEIAAYRFTAVFLPVYDPAAAADILNKGVEANPGEWRLYRDLAFIYWHLGEYAKAAETYERGSDVPGGPGWMKDAAGFMRIKGGSREVARAEYSRYLESDDKNIRAQAEWMLGQLDALDRMDALNQLVSAYKNQFHSCPPDLRGLARWVARMGIPLNDQSDPVDPDGLPYILDPATCLVKFSPSSKFDRW